MKKLEKLFNHLILNAMNEILNKFEDIKQENVSLKRNLKEKLKMISNLDKDVLIKMKDLNF